MQDFESAWATRSETRRNTDTFLEDLGRDLASQIDKETGRPGIVSLLLAIEEVGGGEGTAQGLAGMMQL